jgi:hypothetical protein
MSAHRLVWLLPALFLLLCLPPGARAEDDMKEILPPVSCGAGWQMEGKQLFYDRDTLSDRIDGEAELYFPYGFERMAAARYVSKKRPEAGIDVEVYRMGSLLDSFGMYANYRQKDGSSIAVGAESNLSPSQLFLYQGRLFIHIQVTGSNDDGAAALAECGRAVALRLPGTKDMPSQLLALERPEVVKGTERYLPQSLLGYDFLNKGIMVDAVVGGTNLQIFLLLGTTAESASAVFDRYRSLLTLGKVESGGKDVALLVGGDPLYGPVMILRKGGCLAGALKFAGAKGVRVLLEGICR